MIQPFSFGGIQLGQSRLFGICLSPDGTVLGRFQAPIKDSKNLPWTLKSAVESLRLTCPESYFRLTIAWEKKHSCQLTASLDDWSDGVGLVTIPALAANLLGHCPSKPCTLLSLGSEVRLVVIDSTMQYREYRIQEGGGHWWQAELTKLSQHSPRLGRHLQAYPQSKVPLKALTTILEQGMYPSPDPVLMPRLQKIADHLAQALVYTTMRLPGIRHFALSGFLSQSALGQLVERQISKLSPNLRPCSGDFPPEVGAALLGLAWQREDQERQVLQKPPFLSPRSGQDWQPPPELLRRLYRLRKPFERYS